MKLQFGIMSGMKKRHFAVTSEDGVAQLHPLKQWFRATQHVAESTDWTSHQMRSYLKKQGWQIQESADQVLVVKPGTEGLDKMADDDEDESTDAGLAESAESSLFALESHLRDYLAKNLNAVITSRNSANSSGHRIPYRCGTDRHSRKESGR